MNLYELSFTTINGSKEVVPFNPEELCSWGTRRKRASSKHWALTKAKHEFERGSVDIVLRNLTQDLTERYDSDLKRFVPEN